MPLACGQCKGIGLRIIALHWLQTAVWVVKYLFTLETLLVLKPCPFSPRANVTWINLAFSVGFECVHGQSPGSSLAWQWLYSSEQTAWHSGGGKWLVTREKGWEVHKVWKHNYTLIFHCQSVCFYDLMCFNFSSVVKYILH